MYIFKKNILRLYIKYIYIWYKLYEYKIPNICCMCVYLYIHNKYTQYTLIYYVNKNFILDAINRD